jgi:hypothetical protein
MDFWFVYIQILRQGHEGLGSFAAPASFGAVKSRGDSRARSGPGGAQKIKKIKNYFLRFD